MAYQCAPDRSGCRPRQHHRREYQMESRVTSLHSMRTRRIIARLKGLVPTMAVVALVGCSRAPVVTITNRSTNVLANVIVSGSGFSNRIESIGAGAESRLTVRPRGESGLRIAFDACGQRV